MPKHAGKRIVTTVTTVRKVFDGQTGQNVDCQEDIKEEVRIEIEGEEEIAAIIRKALGVSEKAKIEFDAGCDFLRGCIVTYERG